MVEWFEPAQALQIPHETLQLTHAPAGKVTLEVAHTAGEPVTAIAYNATGQVVDQKTAPPQQGTVHELELSGEGIVRVTLRGGGGEGLLISYCIEPLQSPNFTTHIAEHIAESVRTEIPDLTFEGNRLKARRCCFKGSLRLPPDAKPSKWDVYLTVQNVNQVPEGTPPEQAATVIGGHVLSAHTSPEVLGCTAIMLLDHVFDVF